MIGSVYSGSADSANSQALERATYTTKSFLIGLALVQKQITAEEAALASHVEVNSQIEKWGEVEDCKTTLLNVRTARNSS